MISKRQNLLGYTFLLPALLVMAVCGVLPMAFVAYYSVHDTFGGKFSFGLARPGTRTSLPHRNSMRRWLAAWASPRWSWRSRFPWASISPLRMPTKGVMASVYIALMTIPLLDTFARRRLSVGGIGPAEGWPALRSTVFPWSQSQHEQLHRGMAGARPDGFVALDKPGGSALLRRSASHSGRLLPGRPRRRREQLGGVPIHSASETSYRPAGRDTLAVHG